jgi:hypothetical protein
MGFPFGTPSLGPPRCESGPTSSSARGTGRASRRRLSQSAFGSGRMRSRVKPSPRMPRALSAAWSGVRCSALSAEQRAEVGYLLTVEPLLKDGATLELDGLRPEKLANVVEVLMRVIG